jgi:hypothetical protein
MKFESFKTNWSGECNKNINYFFGKIYYEKYPIYVK